MTPPADPFGPDTTIDQLRKALSTQPVIEQAKGMLMLNRNWSSDEAFMALREISQHTNTKLHDVAAVIVACAGKGEPGLADADAATAVLDETSRMGFGYPFTNGSASQKRT
ncbi:ANTAR domain-containing protein [Lentzea sp. DG1S-22]|uniref:ANTAR domain-containing protein n=1 Tax=Lentzea sp. DG1S-22 TaxID=3108822 RepID=UPI002E787184|nr:ANTAR domain-containing protein [Lentzea sp. DG1S-22]WVH82338.1 ANTAR domain-containing protein [Lentzea sp. DG1S-22]